MKFDHPTIPKDIIKKFKNLISSLQEEDNNGEERASEVILFDMNAIPSAYHSNLPFDYFVSERIGDEDYMDYIFYYFNKVKNEFIKINEYGTKHHIILHSILLEAEDQVYFTEKINQYPHIDYNEWDIFRSEKIGKVLKKLNESVSNIEEIFNDFVNDFFRSLNDNSLLEDSKISYLYEYEGYEDYAMVAILRTSNDKKDYYIEITEGIDDGFFNKTWYFKYNNNSNTFESIEAEDIDKEDVDYVKEITYIDYLEWFNKSQTANNIFKRLHESNILRFKDFIK